MLAAVTLFASCSQEEIVTKTEGESLVSFTVTTPELGSRAVGDGTTAKNLYYAVYDGKGEIVTTVSNATDECPNDVVSLDDKKATVTFPLLNGETYSILFWAEAEAEADKMATVNWSNKILSVNPTTSNKETYDAFYAYVEEFVVTGDKQEQVKLYRPFAQLNIGTTDDDLLNATKYFFGNDQTTNLYTQSTIKLTVPTAMNLVTGKVSDERVVTYSAADFLTERLKGNYQYLSMNYLLVSSEKSLVDVEFSCFAPQQNANQYIVKDFKNVPVQRNYKTNIYGTLFTSSTKWQVEILPGFQTPDNDLVTYAVSTEAELKKATATGAIVTLTNDIELTSALTFANNVEINGQGFAIKGYPVTFTGKAVSIRNAKFAGVDNANHDASNIYVATGNEKFIVENCEFSDSQWDAIQYTAENATNVTINNCVFKAENPVARAIHLQVKNESAAQVVITNNKIFNGNNYEKNNNDKDIVCVYGFAKANMTLEGNVVYDVAALDNVLIWISNGKNDAELVGTNGFSVGGKSVASSTDITTALNSNAKVTLSNNVTTSSNISLANGKELDGAGNTLYIDNLEETSGLALGLTVAGGTIKNLTIDGQNQASANNNGYRAIYIVNPQEDVILENVNITGVLYPFNTGTMSGAKDGVKFSVSNSTFAGWSSFSGFESAKFENCNFEVGSYKKGESIYNQGIAPYVTTVFENCDFAKGYYFDMSKFVAGATLTFKNCTVDGVKLTKEMFEAVTSSKDPVASQLAEGKTLWFEESANCKIDNVTIE